MRRTAQDALTQYVQNETQLNLQDEAIERQEDAAEMQLYGTGAGIGGAVGVNKALKAKDAAAAAKEAAGAATKPGGLLYQPGGLEYAAGIGPAPSPTAGVGQVAEMTKALGDTTQAVNTVNTGGAVAAGGVPTQVGGQKVVEAGLTKGVEAVGTKAATGASSGLMSTISTIATPLAIGLGAAFLINKLFG